MPWNGSGDSTVTSLHLDGARFMKPAFIEECLQHLNIVELMGESLTPLERLAVEVLIDSAYISRQEMEDEL